LHEIKGFFKPRVCITRAKIHHVDACFSRIVKLTLPHIFRMTFAVTATWIRPITMCARGNPAALHEYWTFEVPRFGELFFPALIIFCHPKCVLPKTVSFVDHLDQQLIAVRIGRAPTLWVAD